MAAFVDCAKEAIYELVIKAINCTSPDLKAVFKVDDIIGSKPPCATDGARKEMLFKVVNAYEEFIQNMDEFNCTLPCSITSYKIRFVQ